jgi:hypothetical protein
MLWKPKIGKCKRMPNQSLTPVKKVAGMAGFVCAIAALILLFEDWLRRLAGIKPSRNDVS